MRRNEADNSTTAGYIKKYGETLWGKKNGLTPPYAGITLARFCGYNLSLVVNETPRETLKTYNAFKLKLQKPGQIYVRK